MAWILIDSLSHRSVNRAGPMVYRLIFLREAPVVMPLRDRNGNLRTERGELHWDIRHLGKSISL